MTRLSVPPRQDCSCRGCGKRGYGRPKTKASTRTIHLPEPTIRLHSDPNVFGEDGFDITRHSVWGRVKRVLKEAGAVFSGLAEDTSFPRALRATCATPIASKGATCSASRKNALCAAYRRAAGWHRYQKRTARRSLLQGWVCSAGCHQTELV